MGKNKTAVEWFAEQLGIDSGSMLEKAKKMEYDQMLDIWQSALLSDIRGGKNFDMYHYAKYKQEEQE